MSVASLFVAFLLQAAAGRTAPGSLSGRVTDSASGQPLPRMVVTLFPADHTTPIEGTTDVDGRYQFTNVVPGKYAVAAEPDEHHATYLRQWFGGEAPADAFAPPPPPNVEIAPGTARTDVNVALTRALAVEGRVVDPFGEPLPGVTVAVVTQDGRMLPVPTSVSDDLGAYRVYGLRPGRYHVCADVRSSNNFLWPSDKPPPPRTCYPSSFSDRDAAEVSVSTQDVINVDIQMRGTAAAAVSDAAESSPGAATDVTGTIEGRVADKETGKPVAHAMVRLLRRGDSQYVRTFYAVTGDDGLYRFGGLPPGRYAGSAGAARHRSSPLLDDSHSPDVTVGRGQVRETSAALARAYAIDLRLVDVFGDPVSDVGVSVRFAEDGRPSAGGFAASSDDRGHLRLPGLAPGRYVLCAESPDYSASSRPTTAAKRDRLLRTCYPSAVNEAEAQFVSVDRSDVEDLELHMVRGRALSITGTIVDAAGAPAAHATAALMKIDAGSERTRGFDTDARGHFRLVNVLPGTYAIEATAGSGAAFVPIDLSEDANDIVVALQRLLNVRGRIAFDDPQAAPPSTADGRPVRVTARLAGDRLPGPASTQSALSNPDRTFLLENVFGRRTIDVANVPSGWFVSAIRYGSKEVIDAPVDFKEGDQTLDVVLSRRGGSISGTIAEIRDHRVDRAQVFLFRAAATKDGPPRFVGAASTDGSFRFAPLRDGDYLIAAVPADVSSIRDGDWDRMARIAALAERVTLGALDVRTVDLRIVDPR